MPQAAGFQFISSNTNDTIQFWNGTARSNATIQVQNLLTLLRTTSAATAGYQLFFRYDQGTTTGQPDIGTLAWEAEDSLNNFKPYAMITAQIEDDTSTSRDASLFLGVASESNAAVSNPLNLPVGIQIQGGGTGAVGVKIGAFGVTPVIQQVVAGGASVATVITALKNLGWFV